MCTWQRAARLLHACAARKSLLLERLTGKLCASHDLHPAHVMPGRQRARMRRAKRLFGKAGSRLLDLQSELRGHMQRPPDK